MISRSSFSSHSRVCVFIYEHTGQSNPTTGWKRLLFADGPRQTINALTLYSFYIASNSDHSKPFYDLSKYSDNFITTGLIITTLFTVLIFAGSLLLLIAAGIGYIPLLCYIQGNLKVRTVFDNAI